MPCLKSASNLIQKIPGIQEKVELWEEYETSDQTVDNLQQNSQHISKEYDTILKETRLNEIIEECKQLLHILETRDGNYNIPDVDKTLSSPVVLMLHQCYQQLTTFYNKITLLYKAADNKAATSCQLHKLKERTEKITKVINDNYYAQLSDHPVIGVTLSQAEIYRTHFTSSLYEPAKDLINEATEILKELKNQCDDEMKTNITNHLTQVIEPFTLLLQKIQNNYIEIHIFHMLLEKFQKWYRKVLVFLPEYLRHIGRDYPDKLVTMPDEWLHTVDTFLTKHPFPRDEHIAKLDLEIPTSLPRHIKQQAHNLALRIKLLQRLLTSRRLPVKLITASMKWKDEISSVIPVQSKPNIQIDALSVSTVSREDSFPETETKERVKNKQKRRKSFPRDDLSVGLSSDQHDEQYRPEPERFIRVTFTPKDTQKDERFSFGEVSKDTPKVTEKPKPRQRKLFQRDDVPVALLADQPNGMPENKMDDPERFIRVTFTPKATQNEEKFTFDKLNIDSTDQESGIDLVDVKDPYDAIVSKIKEVSNSQMSNSLKLKYVTNLLSCSLHDINNHKNQHSFNSDIGTDSKTHYKKRYAKGRRFSKLKPHYAQSVENLCDLEPTTLKSFQSLRNLSDLRLRDGDSDIVSLHNYSDQFLSKRSSFHDVFDELEPNYMTADLSKWYQDYDGTYDDDTGLYIDSPDMNYPSLEQDILRLRLCQNERLLEEDILETEKQRHDQIATSSDTMYQQNSHMVDDIGRDITDDEEWDTASQVN
ncbi:hypothetical protein SNE40_003350 [Patella caerulea]|uniref:Uncharacterized protein n=1 Tax=Patella caerulea TaxID=87958 RepID=A0AAN8KDR5_PATCE